MCRLERSKRLRALIEVGPATPSTVSLYLRWNAFNVSIVPRVKRPLAAALKPSAARSCCRAITSAPCIPNERVRLPNDRLDVSEFASALRVRVEVLGVVSVVLDVNVVPVVVLVVFVVLVVGVVEVQPRPVPPLLPEQSADAAEAGPATNAQSITEVAARRRQPVTALRYDKPNPSLSLRLRG